MRFLLLNVLMLTFSAVYAQNFEDGFSDGDFTRNPVWSGDVNNFVITELEGNYVVRLYDPGGESGTSYLSTPSTSVTGFWEFWVQIDGSLPSGSNNIQVFLMSDLPDLTGPVNGYVVRAGETGEDVFRILRYDAGVESAVVVSDTTILQRNTSYRIRVERDDSGIWNISVAEGYYGLLRNSGNTGSDSTYTTSGYFGFLVNYTSSRTSDYYFDFRIDPPPVFVNPLYIDDLSVYSTSQLDLVFTGDIDHTSVLRADLVLNESFTFESYSNLGSDGVRITFPVSFKGGENILKVAGIESAANDTVLSDTTLFFYNFDAFEKGDVIINEFLKDPPPGSGLPEYVELRNTTEKFLNLRGWKAGDRNSLSMISEEDLQILPDSFLVITTDPVAIEAAFGEGAYVKVSMAALNNSGDQIRIYDSSGVMVDSLQYTAEWGGVDVALERRDDIVASTIPANWGDSPNRTGTPGRKNEVEKDRVPPEIIRVSTPDNRTIQIIFSEPLNTERATDPANYSTVPSLDLIEITSESNTVRLRAASEFSDGDMIEITIRNQQDIFGNLMENTIRTVTYTELTSALPGEVVVNEIMYRRADGASPEFIELYNNSSENFELSGWTIADAGNSSGDIPEGVILRAGEYLVLTDIEGFAESQENGVYISGFPSLNDRGDEIKLKNVKSVTIDTLFYRDAWGGDEPGVSLERIDPGRASNDPSNWASNMASGGNTAGDENSVFESDYSPPSIIFANFQDYVVQIIFSEFVEITPQSIFEVNGIESEVLSFDERQANKVAVEYPSPETDIGGAGGLVTVGDIQDIKGNLAERISSPIAFPLTGSKVRINEILFDPLADNDDNLPDQTEYVELYNPGTSAVSLESMVLHDAADEDGRVRLLSPVTSSFKWIPSGGYFLIYAEDQAMIFEESRVYEYFSMEGETDQFTMRVGRSGLSLSSVGDAIFLADTTGAVIDSVFYEESWHNPNLFDMDGIALEKINPFGPSNDEQNWSSSTHVSGGTPKARNSIYQEAGVSPEDTGISFRPNPFSPDGDGFEDHLFINYKLDAPDYLIRIRIFDRYGRQVRELADGYQAGFEGTLIWDGLTGDRRTNRVGIYIVLFEAYNSSAGADRVFKETVVLARMF